MISGPDDQCVDFVPAEAAAAADPQARFQQSVRVLVPAVRLNLFGEHRPRDYTLTCESTLPSGAHCPNAKRLLKSGRRSKYCSIKCGARMWKRWSRGVDVVDAVDLFAVEVARKHDILVYDDGGDPSEVVCRRKPIVRG